MDLLLKTLVERGASDGFAVVDAPLTIKVDGHLYPLDDTILSASDVSRLIAETMSPEQLAQF